MSKFLNFLRKLQNLPDKQKQFILWSIVGIIGLIMAIFWLLGAVDTFNNYFK
jgi:hypothetical protein